MNETLQLWSARLRDILNRFSPNQKRNFGIAAGAVLVCLITVLWLVMRPNYVTIMTGLDNKSLGQVQTQLSTLKIPSQIQGSSVLVPSKDANTARVQLAMAGLPSSSGTIDYSSITNSFGMTQDYFNLQVLNVLQNSLAQTIESIDGIENANVHIVMPTNSVFVSQQTDAAKASVFVQLGTGVQLSPVQVAGIQQLVSHAVTGLTSSDVTVVDQNGNTLSSSGSSATTTAGSSNSELATRTQIENQLQQQLLAGLNSIVGSGNAQVVVQANVTFNVVQTKSHTYFPLTGTTTGLIANQQKISNTTTSGTSATTGGVAGQSSSNPGLSSYAGAGSGYGTNGTQSQVTTTYDNSYKDSTVIGDPIQINGFSVGVMLNSADKALTPAVVRQIKAWVTNAVGQQGGTKNSISVVAVPFQTTNMLQSSAHSLSLPMWAGLGALLLVLGGGTVLLVRRRRRGETMELQTALPPGFEGVELETLPPTEDEYVREQLMKLANQKPTEFANLLRTWLVGD